MKTLIGRVIGALMALVGGKITGTNIAAPLLLDADGNLMVTIIDPPVSASGELINLPTAGGGESDITWDNIFSSAVFYVDQSGTSLDLQITGVQIAGSWFTLGAVPPSEIPVIMFDANHNPVPANQITGGPFSNFFYLNIIGITGVRITNNAPASPGETPIIRYELRRHALNFA